MMGTVSMMDVGVAGRMTMTMAQMRGATMTITTVVVLGVHLRMVSVSDLFHLSVETVVLVRGVFNDASGAVRFLQCVST